MATALGKRKREDALSKKGDDENVLHVQIVTGYYERVLHGIAARIPRHLLKQHPDGDKASSEANQPKVTFTDNFLFAAHASSIRCLAISPPTEADKRFLATGSSDERINVYSISTTPSKTATTFTAENPRNRSLGSLIHHDRAITRLDFPTKSKLFSAAEDNTIAISRTRDWTVLSSIKAPLPKPQGRPSGDTAGPGEIPAGVNDFAIHPSQKLMLSVGRGERCLRLWNLMTGKKAGVLNFDRDLLSQVGEGNYSSGEGRRVLWDEAGESYVVGFEKGAAVFGIDSKPKAIIKPSPPTKLHQMRMLQLDDDATLAVSTEDGRVLFYSIDATSEPESALKLPSCSCTAEIGGKSVGSRIKDFEILKVPELLVVAAGSDGVIRLFSQGGELLGKLDTGNRITCVGAFIMDGTSHEEDGQDEDAGPGGDGEEDEEEESD
jgi:protein MAK11